MAHAEVVLDLLKQRHGILLKRTFYDTWYQSQSTNTSTPERLYQSVLPHFLNTDIASSSQPSIQRQGLGKRTITLQLQDTLDTSHSLSTLVEALDKNGPLTRGSLKWIMTDGAQDIVVYELNKNTTFGLKTPFGSKIQITSGEYVNGLLLVKPEHIKLLGGQVKALYGDTMENELLRRYTQRLKDQGKAPGSETSVPRSTPVPGSTPIPAYQNIASSVMPTPTVGRMTINNGSNTSTSTSNDIRSNIPLNTTIPTLSSRSDENNDDEFDSLPIDDLTALDELEQQALDSTFKTPPMTNTATVTITTNLPPVSHSSNTVNRRVNEPYQHSTASALVKRRPTLSLSTKPPKKRSNTSQSVPPLKTTSPHATPSRSSRNIIDLDDSPPPSPSATNPPQTSITQHLMSDFDFDDSLNLDGDYSFDDSMTLHASPSPPPQPQPPEILTVSELGKLLRSVDDNSFSGNYDTVSVKVQGCRLRSMKPILHKGLYLVAELFNVYGNEPPIMASFIYYGTDSLYEGYSIKDLHTMKDMHGINMVRDKLFKPLAERFLTIEAELEIDLMVTENHESGLVRKGIRFTPMSPAG